MKYTKNIALASGCGLVFFLITIILMHLLRPDLHLLSSSVSEYAVGDYGWLMTNGFLSLAISALLLETGLLLSIRASKTSIITLSLFCIGSFLFTIFPTDIPVNKPTPRGLVHGFSALLALLNLGIAMIVWGFVFKKTRHWSSLAKLSWFFGVVSLVLFILFLATPVPFRGFSERILMGWDISWLIVISRRLYQHAALVATV